MTSYNHITNTLKQLSPMEVIEMCGLSEDSAQLTNALAEYIEDEFELIEQNLVGNGVINEDDV